MDSLSVMGVGFVGNRFCEMYPDAYPESRNTITPARDDVLFTRGTTTNYHPLNGDLDIDIDTNQKHLLKVLPNVKGTFNLTSSWFCFGFAAGYDAARPARETDPCDPNGFYSISRHASEQMLRSYCQMKGKSYRVLRLCNVIGNDPRANKQKNALVMMIAKVKRGEDIEVYTGDCYRSILHIDDACRAIRICLERAPLNEIVNIGQPSVRIYDLIQHALYITGSKSKVTLVAPPRFHTIVQTESFHMCVDKLRGLGFVPDMDPYQAVERVLANL